MIVPFAGGKSFVGRQHPQASEGAIGEDNALSPHNDYERSKADAKGLVVLPFQSQLRGRASTDSPTPAATR